MKELAVVENNVKVEKGNLYQRINVVMLEVEGVEKGVTVAITNSRSYKAVSHDDVTRLLHMPIARAGLIVSTSVIESKIDILEKVKEYNGNQTVSKEYMATVLVELTVINIDNPEERTSLKMPAIAFDSGDKAFGKAISMATKYGLLKLFMLDSYDEEEKRDEPGATYSRKPSSLSSKLNSQSNKPTFKLDDKPKNDDVRIVTAPKEDTIKLLKAFEKLNVSIKQIFNYLNQELVHQLTTDEVEHLRGVWRDINSGKATVEELFGK